MRRSRVLTVALAAIGVLAAGLGTRAALADDAAHAWDLSVSVDCGEFGPAGLQYPGPDGIEWGWARLPQVHASVSADQTYRSVWGWTEYDRPNAGSGGGGVADHHEAGWSADPDGPILRYTDHRDIHEPGTFYLMLVERDKTDHDFWPGSPGMVTVWSQRFEWTDLVCDPSVFGPSPD